MQRNTARSGRIVGGNFKSFSASLGFTTHSPVRNECDARIPKIAKNHHVACACVVLCATPRRAARARAPCIHTVLLCHWPLPCQSQSKERARPSACVRERNHIPHVRVRAQAGAGPFRAAVRTQSSSVVSRIGLGRTRTDFKPENQFRLSVVLWWVLC